MPSVKQRKLKFMTASGCGCLLLTAALNLTLGTIGTHYCVEHLFHKVIGYGICMLIGLVAGEVIIPVFLVTWLLVLAGAIQ